MDIQIAEAEGNIPAERCYIVSITIKSFKGRKDVEVHLFRHTWDEEEFEAMDWDAILEPGKDKTEEERTKSKHFFLEAFTQEERDQLLQYLQSHYHDRLVSITALPLSFPIPAGLTPLSRIPLGENIGLIMFEKIPHYDLPFGVHGLYDLGQHKPLVEYKGEGE